MSGSQQEGIAQFEVNKITESSPALWAAITNLDGLRDRVRRHFRPFYDDFMDGTTLRQVMWFDWSGEDSFNVCPEGLEQFMSYIEERVYTAPSEGIQPQASQPGGSQYITQPREYQQPLGILYRDKSWNDAKAELNVMRVLRSLINMIECYYYLMHGRTLDTLEVQNKLWRGTIWLRSENNNLKLCFRHRDGFGLGNRVSRRTVNDIIYPCQWNGIVESDGPIPRSAPVSQMWYAVGADHKAWADWHDSEARLNGRRSHADTLRGFFAFLKNRAQSLKHQEERPRMTFETYLAQGYYYPPQ